MKGAIEAYRGAIGCNPRLAPAHYNLGNALFSEGNLPGAVTAYRNAINSGWDNATGNYNLANALYLTNDLDGAITEYREALRHDPKFSMAHTSLGIALMDKGDANGAVAAHTEAVRHDPKNAVAEHEPGYRPSPRSEVRGSGRVCLARSRPLPAMPMPAYWGSPCKKWRRARGRPPLDVPQTRSGCGSRAHTRFALQISLPQVSESVDGQPAAEE